MAYQLTVQSQRGAALIAKAIGRHNPQAANAYLDKFELRKHIEQAAVEGFFGPKFN